MLFLRFLFGDDDDDDEGKVIKKKDEQVGTSASTVGKKSSRVHVLVTS